MHLTKQLSRGTFVHQSKWEQKLILCPSSQQYDLGAKTIIHCQVTLSDQAAQFCSGAGLRGAENVQDKMVHMRSVGLDRLNVHHSRQPAASVLLLQQSFQALAHALSPPPPCFSLWAMRSIIPEKVVRLWQLTSHRLWTGGRMLITVAGARTSFCVSARFSTRSHGLSSSRKVTGGMSTLTDRSTIRPPIPEQFPQILTWLGWQTVLWIPTCSWHSRWAWTLWTYGNVFLTRHTQNSRFPTLLPDRLGQWCCSPRLCPLSRGSFRWTVLMQTLSAATFVQQYLAESACHCTWTAQRFFSSRGSAVDIAVDVQDTACWLQDAASYWPAIFWAGDEPKVDSVCHTSQLQLHTYTHAYAWVDTHAYARVHTQTYARAHTHKARERERERERERDACMCIFIS